MTALSLLGICGSTRKASLNRALLLAVGEVLPEGTAFSTWEGLETLPIFNSDLQEPPSVISLKSAITTEIQPAGEFYYAEDYHQQYLGKNPGGYCGLGGTGVSCPIGVGA